MVKELGVVVQVYEFRSYRFRVWGSGLRVQNPGFMIWGSGFGVQGLESRVCDSEFRV
jgi:hypothetical protein